MSEIAVREEPQQMTALSQAQLNYIASTEFVPPGLRGNLPAIMACVATGRALGIADMTALRSIHIIDGKATFSAELMVQLVRKRGHSITGEVDDGSATVTGRRTDNGDEMTVTWTLGMAERAGLLSKGNWRKYPEAMLWARAASQLCRMLFADCFAGATYTPEELGAGDVSADELIEDSGPEPSAGGDPVAADVPVGEQPSGPDNLLRRRRRRRRTSSSASCGTGCSSRPPRCTGSLASNLQKAKSCTGRRCGTRCRSSRWPRSSTSSSGSRRRPRRRTCCGVCWSIARRTRPVMPRSRTHLIAAG